MFETHVILVLGACRIQGHRVFVGVEVEMRIRALGVGSLAGEGAAMSDRRAHPRLDEDDLGAEVREQAAGEGCRRIGEIENPDAG